MVRAVYEQEAGLMNPVRLLALVLIGLSPASLAASSAAAEGYLDPGAVETVRGQVVRVEKVSSGLDSAPSVYLILDTDAGQRIAVTLGPDDIVEGGTIRIGAGDRIEVIGWQIVRGKPSLVAAEVNKAGEILLLRDRHGVPVWTLR
jgi:hypothetical protein